MPRAPNPQKGKAKKLWKKGRNATEIAKELGIPEGTARRWKSEWEKGNERSHQTSAKETSAHNKRGAPEGNSNAKGNAGGGAPPGNQNRTTHGAYAANLCWDTFTDEERALLEGQGELDEETRLQNDIRTLDVRERRLMKMIAEQKTAALAVGYVNKVTGADGPKTITHAESTFDRIQHLESLLTSVQRAKLRYVNELRKLRLDNEKLILLKKKLSDSSIESIEKLDELLKLVEKEMQNG